MKQENQKSLKKRMKEIVKNISNQFSSPQAVNDVHPDALHAKNRVETNIMMYQITIFFIKLSYMNVIYVITKQ